MATGGGEGCKLVKNGKLQETILKILGDVRLIRAILQVDDPARDFLLKAEKGLTVRILEPLPRTPHVFEEQSKWLLDSEF